MILFISMGKVFAEVHENHEEKRRRILLALIWLKNVFFDKTNEIPATPALLKYELKDCIITINAMGARKGIAN